MIIFLKKLLSILTTHDKKYLVGLVWISILVSFIELIGIGVILPFISVATNFESIHESKYLEWGYSLLELDSDVDFVVCFGGLLLLFYIGRALFLQWYFYLLAKFSRGRYHLIALRLFESYLGMSYHEFTKKTVADLTKTILSETNNITTLVSGFLLVISEVFVVILIYSVMLYINWRITLLITTLLAINAFIIVFTTSKAIKKAGISRDSHQMAFYQIISNTLNNYKFIKLISNNDELSREFNLASSEYANANIKNETLLHTPRLFLEALGFSILIFMIIYLVYKYQTDISGVLPIISLFIVSLYRLMPSLNRILTGLNQIIFYKLSLDKVHMELMYNAEKLGNKKIDFQNKITIENMSFSYSSKSKLLENISLTIHKGDTIALTGPSGCGKSTLVDIIIGLYKPVSGRIKVDNIPLDESNLNSWRSHIGYVPQNIHLFDGSVAQNVAFGQEYDATQVKKVLIQAKIYDFFENNYQGISTPVGDDGIQLSGGQRQRIAIGRALYRNPDILVFDEATSALDMYTHKQIMKELALNYRDKTIIIISHNLDYLSFCDQIFSIENNQLKDIKSPENNTEKSPK